MELVINNRQRARPIDRKFLKGVTEHLLGALQIKQTELGVHLVNADEMARVHKHYMNIEGSTDVITFDHGSRPPETVHGEIFVSIDDAITQAREFDATWQNELARYIVHGVLHLLGYDDLQPKARAKMKREENRLVRELESTFNLRDIEKR